MRLGILVGEKSADNLGAALLRDIRHLVPEATFVGCGGTEMAKEGLRSLDVDLELFGIVEVIRHLPRLFRERRRLINFFLEEKIDVFIGIDLPDFNIGIEQALHQQSIKTVHYVSPTIWAWRAKRATRFLRANDAILCLYPFEPAIYGSSKAVFVGHPMAKAVPMVSSASKARKRIDLEDWIGTRKVIAILPGSRRSETKRLLSDFVQAAELCYQKDSNICCIISAANEERRAQINTILKRERLTIRYRVVTGNTRNVIAASDQVLVASGTATLETLLVKRPMVIAYKVHRFSAWLIRRLFTDSFQGYVGQPNILAGKEIVPEFLQSQVQADALAKACMQQLTQDTSQLHDQFVTIHKTLRCHADRPAATAIVQLYRQGVRAI